MNNCKLVIVLIFLLSCGNYNVNVGSECAIFETCNTVLECRSPNQEELQWYNSQIVCMHIDKRLATLPPPTIAIIEGQNVKCGSDCHVCGGSLIYPNSTVIAVPSVNNGFSHEFDVRHEDTHYIIAQLGLPETGVHCDPRYWFIDGVCANTITAWFIGC